MAEPRYRQLYFDPDEHPEDTLKAFEEFIKVFELRYDAQYPDPPKVSMDAAIERWKYANADDAGTQRRPTLDEYDEIRVEWREKDKVAKLLGMYSAARLYADWEFAVDSESARKNASWATFVGAMKKFYKPTENTTLKNYHFRSLFQKDDETFVAFCNRVSKEAKHCQFNCESGGCTAEEIAVRDQVVIGTKETHIRDEALLKGWDLQTLRLEGMKMESAAKSGAAITAGESLNKIGKYSYKNQGKSKDDKEKKSIKCFNCGNKIDGSIMKHKTKCPAKSTTCKKCNKVGHFATVCKNKDVKQIQSKEGDSQDKAPDTEEAEEESYAINVFRIQELQNNTPDIEHESYSMNVSRIKAAGVNKTSLRSPAAKKSDFRVQVVINNTLDTVISDSGARICVAGTKQGAKWGLLDRMVPSRKKIKPYNSEPIKVHGEARCSVSFGSSSIPVVWHFISGSCEPILSGNASLQLGILQFNSKPDTFHPVLMIDSECKRKDNVQDILAQYPENFQGLGKLKNHQVRLHVDETIKPVCVPPRPLPYHLRDRAQKVIDEMIEQEVIEKHPPNEPAQWVSNTVLAPKSDGSIRITLDARNVNKAMLANNHPIPRHEDIKASLANAKIFSKLDFKSAYWQLELEPESRKYTIFHANGELYRYKRLTMGIKPAQGELNAALKSIFAHIPNVYLIHDDLFIATNTDEEHELAILQVMEAVRKSGLTLNPAKCIFWAKEIGFWGMIYSADGVRPDPMKVEALDYITAPENKEELVSFLCMMQSNSDFIQNFAEKSAVLRELTKNRVHFKWRAKHQTCFDELISAFKKDTLLRYFDLSKPTFVFVDAHRTGLGATLSQGDSLKESKPVAFASRTTNAKEPDYPQLDLEALGVDFSLRRFRQYLVGSPDDVTVVTDHKPLCSIFNGNKKGSIRTERIKMRHQDIPAKLVYRKGKLNNTDYISRRGKPFHKISLEEQEETNDLNNLLFALHVTPVTDKIGLDKIAKETQKDEVLSKLSRFVKNGQTWIPKTESNLLKRFEPILAELMLSPKGILLKDDRMILPAILQDEAVELAHRGSHPRQSSMERRLRSHFFFHDMKQKVKKHLDQCHLCDMFSDKKTKEEIQPHQVPTECWKSVAVDLFGPMPTSKHVVVVQDMASRFPAAKLVSSTGADKVIPALKEIYNEYGNPETQLSDNGPPFTSEAMKDFAKERQIELKNTPPIHPAANPSETFMKPVGKTMKIAHYTKANKEEALKELLENYRDTPHPALGISPGAMFLKDGTEGKFPSKSATEEEKEKARARDKEIKEKRKDKVNSSKFRKDDPIQRGDMVLIRNYTKGSKFDPTFLPDPFRVKEILANGRIINIERQTDGKLFKRHPDDLKVFKGLPQKPTEKVDIEKEAVLEWQRMSQTLDYNEEGDEISDNATIQGIQNQSVQSTDEAVCDNAIQGVQNQFVQSTDEAVCEQPGPGPIRKSNRQLQKNKRYFNDDFVNEIDEEELSE